MGWLDYHLHEFRLLDTRFVQDDVEDDITGEHWIRRTPRGPDGRRT